MMGRRHTPQGDPLTRMPSEDAREFAVALLKKAGFVLHTTALNSDSSYYRHPARADDAVLRIAHHSSKKRPIGLNPIVAKITLNYKDPYLSELHVTNLVANAIGRYFIAGTPPSNYDGPKRAGRLSDAEKGDVFDQLNDPARPISQIARNYA